MKLSKIAMRAPMILLVGQQGCGKTVHALTYGSKGQLIDLDGGCQSGLRINDDHTKRRHNIDVQRFVEKQSTVATAFAKFEAHIRNIEREVSKGAWPFETLIIDSFTSLAEIAMRDALQDNQRLGQKERLKDWGDAFSVIKRSFFVLRSMQIPVVCTAHMRPLTMTEIVKGKEKQVTTWVVAIPGQTLPPSILSFFDEILFMTLRRKGKSYVPVLRSMPTSTIPAKTRAGIPNNLELTMSMRKFVAMCDMREDSPLKEKPKTKEITTKAPKKEIATNGNS